MKTRIHTARAAVLCGAIVGFLSALSPAQAAGPFDALGGQWAGSGTASLNDGSTERLRCTATYNVAGSSLKLNVVCATDSFKLDARSDVHYTDGFLNGHWNETSRNLGGDVSGSANGNTIKVNLESGGSTLFGVTLVTNGSAQTVRIVPQQGTSIKNVSISMARK